MKNGKRYSYSNKGIEEENVSGYFKGFPVLNDLTIRDIEGLDYDVEPIRCDSRIFSDLRYSRFQSTIVSYLRYR